MRRVAALACFLLLALGVFTAQGVGAATSCTIEGTKANDHLSGTSGPDVTCGRGGHDRISGHAGADDLLGGRGSDIIQTGNGRDEALGGQGQDSIGAGLSRAVQTLRGGAQNDYLYGSEGNEHLLGGEGMDFILAYFHGHALVRGGRGPDECLWSADGQSNDRILGGAGRDTYEADSGDAVTSAERLHHCASVHIPH